MEEERRTHYFKFIKSLGKYFAKDIDSFENDGYCAEVHIKLPKFGGTYIGYHKILIYTNGELEDFSINGWTFSFKVEGSYSQNWGKSFYEPEFDIQALDPSGNVCSFHIVSKGWTTQYDLPHDFYTECVQDFFNCIHFYSNFNNRKEAGLFNELIHLQSNDYCYENEIEKAKKMSDYYKKIKGTCTNSSFLEKLKEIINTSLDRGINKINKDINKLKEAKV